MSVSSPDKHIVAMGSFSMEPNNPSLNQHTLQLADKLQPKVCFLPTAGGDSDRSYLSAAYTQTIIQTPSPLDLVQSFTISQLAQAFQYSR